MPYLACKDLGMCQAGFTFFSITRNFPWGVRKSKHSHADGEGVDLGIVVDKVVEAHFPGVDDDLVAVVIGHDPQGGNGQLGAHGREERVPMAVQDPEFRIAQAVVPGQFQQIVAFLDAVVLDGPHQGEGLGVDAFRGGSANGCYKDRPRRLAELRPTLCTP